jgi:hypothetical protein
MLGVTFGRAESQRLFRSSTFLAHAETVAWALAAAFSYRFFLSGVTRIAKRSVSGFSIGGRPLGRFFGWSMSLIIVRTNNSHKMNSL